MNYKIYFILIFKMDEKEDNNDHPLLDDIISSENKNLGNENEIEKNDEKMRDAFENYSKLLNKMKKNVDNMGKNKLMNYQNLFNEFNNDMIHCNEEYKKLLELKEILNSETNLPENVKNNLSKVNKDLENKNKIFEQLKNTVEEYKEKYTKDENKKYDNLFNDDQKEKNEDEDKEKQKLIIKNNEEILEERKNLIIQAKKTSSQVVDTTKVIKNVVNQQGENINDIENNIIEAVDNFKKGGEEIKKFKKKTEKKINNRKLCFAASGAILLFLIIFYFLKNIF